MGKLSTLLKWYKTIVLKDQHDVPIRDRETNEIVTVTLRVIGDRDLEEAARLARLASGIHRLKLLNDESDEYKDEVAPFGEAEKLYCIQMILAGEGANWTQEALSAVERPDDPTLDEVAIDPDAPTLEELEKFDARIQEIKDEFNKALETYVSDRQKILYAELDNLSLEELQKRAKDSVVIVRPIEIYLNTLLDQKVWRSVYSDKEMTIKEFNSFDEFANTDIHIKSQLRETYQALEEGRENVKN